MDNGDETPGFNKKLVKAICKSVWKDEKIRLSGDAAILFEQYLLAFVREGLHRAMAEADAAQSEQVDLEHLEAIMAQLLMDF